MAIARERIVLPPREDAAFPQAVHDEAMKHDLRSLVSSLQTVLGVPLLALTVAAPNAGLIREWLARQQSPTPEQEKRLRATYEVVQTLLAWEAPDTIRAWFTGMDPYLDDTAPALVLAKDPVAVLQAAHGFIAA